VTTHDSRSRSHSVAQVQEYSPRTSAGYGPRRLRLFYFGAASLWGFVVGVAGLLVALGFTGDPPVPAFPAVLGLVPAAGIAIAGAGIIAGAYGEAKRRRR
jgi:hypothetical protein